MSNHFVVEFLPYCATFLLVSLSNMQTSLLWFKKYSLPKQKKCGFPSSRVYILAQFNRLSVLKCLQGCNCVKLNLNKRGRKFIRKLVLVGQSEKASLTTCKSPCMYKNHTSSLSIITTILNDHSLLNFCFLLFSTIFSTTIKSTWYHQLLLTLRHVFTVKSVLNLTVAQFLFLDLCLCLLPFWFCFSGRLWSSVSQMRLLFRTRKNRSHSRGFCCHFLILFSSVIWECALGATVKVC